MIALSEWPPVGNVFFQRAALLYNEWLAVPVSRTFAIGMITQAEFESAFKIGAIGDFDTAFNLYQWHWSGRGNVIYSETGIDIRTEANFKKLVAAAWWEMNNTRYTKARDAILAARTEADAAIAACIYFEGAGAEDAAERRGAGAERWSAWIADNAAFITANPAQ